MKTYAFIDASNLFYGGEKSLGWKIDYKKLLAYLREKYDVSEALYFGGVEIHNFPYDYLKEDTVPLKKLEDHLLSLIGNKDKISNEATLVLLEKHLQRIRFYKKLQEFGYTLFLKPVKRYDGGDDELPRRKANCDVDMAFHLMKERDNFDCAVVLSGDGDFLPVLKYLRKIGKRVRIFARGPRTAREIKQFAGSDFRDFEYLETKVAFTELEGR